MCFLRFTTLRRIFSVAAVLILSGFAHADTLDQTNDEGAVEYFTSDLNDLAQSFTVGITGQLTQIEVFLARQSTATTDLTVDIRTMSGAFPTESNVGGNVLATLMRSSGDINVSAGAGDPADGAWETFDLTSLDIDVAAGDELAIVLTNDAVGEYYWYGQGSNPYAGGSVFFRNSGVGGTWVDDSFTKDVDLGFRTYVEAIPEPSSVAVIATLAGIGFLRRRRS